MLQLMIFLKLFSIFLLFIVLAPIQKIILLVSKTPSFMLPKLFHRGVARLLGLQISINGQPLCKQPVIYVANHLSYLDIFVLGGYIDGAFVSKSDVADWPVIGQISRLANTIFIERKPRQVKQHLKELSQNLIGKKHGILFFPEGTANDGSELKPFKTSLFAVLEESPSIPVQAITLAIHQYNKKPSTLQVIRDYYSWHDDTPLSEHLMNFLRRADRYSIELIFHDPVLMDKFDSRKDLADHTHVLIASKLPEFDQPITV